MNVVKAFYHGFFKIYEVEVLEREKFIIYDCGNFNPEFYYKYIIKFKSGKLKFVHENKLTFISE